MKKSFAILFLCLLVLPLFLNLAASQDTGLPSGLNPEQIQNTTGRISAEWDYLGKEWKNILLNNPTVKAVDSFLTKIDGVFFVLFGIHYSLSPALFITIFLWIFFLIAFFGIFKNYASFKKEISLIISFLLVITMSHIKLIELQVNFLMSLLFSNKPWWVRLIFLVVIIAFIGIILILEKTFGKQIAANRKKMKEDLNRLKTELAGKSTEEIAKALSKFSKEGE